LTKLQRPRSPLWLTTLLAIALFVIYQGLIATERYVSSAFIVLDSPTIAAPKLDFGAILSGGGSSGDLLLLREHLLSTDMLKKLDSQLDLRNHYSDRQIDWFSRMSAADLPLEAFHLYYLSRVNIELDEYARVLRIYTQAFSPQMAWAITHLLLREGEAHMNAMGQRLASEQVTFIERQTTILAERLQSAREALIAYQNEHGLISPRAAIESHSAIVASLEGEKAKLEAQRQALATTRSEGAAEMQQLRAQINALEQQIINERGKMATEKGDALNRITIEYETLELQAKFALDLYSSALAVLENTRVEAARQLKQISVLQAPTLPEYSTAPRRLYNITVFVILAILATVIVQMALLIVRDHRD
jgi:capsular polysaccharide transport system permease protein